MKYIEEKKAETGLKRLSEATDIDKLLSQLHCDLDALLNIDQQITSNNSHTKKENQESNSKAKQ